MRVLHLSDLHVTLDDEDLQTLWRRVARTAAGPFHAIILSGDLTQRAAKSEYESLNALIEEDLVPAVGGDAARIISVPGNHDVDWSAQIGQVVSPSDLIRGGDFEPVRNAFKHAMQGSAEHEYRLAHSGYGHFDLVRVDRPEARFSSVQSNFFDKHPAAAGSIRRKQMNLLEPGDDWSAYLFEDDRVAWSDTATSGARGASAREIKPVSALAPFLRPAGSLRLRLPSAPAPRYRSGHAIDLPDGGW